MNETAAGEPRAELRLGLLAAASLAWREVVRFLRQRSRIVGAFGSPVIFWLLIGSGLGKSFHPAGAPERMNYLEYFFPGTVVLILLFSSIFSTYSVIEDRKTGFLQGVLVSPAPRWSIVLGKLVGGAALAWLQGVLFCLLAPMSGLHMGAEQAVLLAAIIFLIAFGMTGMGLAIAWPMESAQGFHAIMNLFLIPMWMLSGALFPPTGAPPWLQWVMWLNPVTYAVAVTRAVFYNNPTQVAGGSPGFALSLVITVIFAVVTFLLCVAGARRSMASSTTRRHSSSR